MILIKSRAWILIGFLLMTPFWAGAAEYDTGVQGKVILQTEATSNGDPIAYLKTDHPKITVMTVDIAPGAKTGWHSHPVPVYAYVMSGRLTVEIEGGKTSEFKEGEAIIEVINTRHNGINHGKIPVKLVVFYIGGKDIPNVIKADKP
jgi:quercetin dioxygenase-like cupin family protein